MENSMMISPLEFASLDALADWLPGNAHKLLKSELVDLLGSAMKQHLYEEMAQYSSMRGNGIGVQNVQCRDTDGNILWERQGDLNIANIGLTLNTLLLVTYREEPK